LFRGTLLPFLGLAAIFFLATTRLSRRQALRWISGAVLLFAVLLAPWFARNAVRLGHFPLALTTTNFSLWRGNNPLASGGSYLEDGRTVLEVASEAMRQKLSRLDEMGQSRLFGEEAFKFIRENPLWALRLYGWKFYTFWWFSPQMGILYPGAYLRGYRWYYASIGALALLGERNSLRAIERLQHRPPNTVLHWLDLAGQHAAAVSAVFIHGLHLTQAQVDELWTFVKKNRPIANQMTQQKSGIPGFGEPSRCPVGCGSSALSATNGAKPKPRSFWRTSRLAPMGTPPCSPVTNSRRMSRR